MKTKAILATLLVAAAASADARFAWPYPPKALPPDEIGHWVVINANAWPKSAASELTFRKQSQRLKSYDPRFKTLTESPTVAVASK
jgi:hypothetical protein